MANQPDSQELPELIQQYITNLAKRIRNRHMRRDVVAELSAHFADALTEAPKDVDRDQLAASLVGDFGDAKTLRLLIKRAKKRCRPLWVKFVIRTCQSILILLFIFVAYGAWLLTGKPTISVDYFAKLNDYARPVADESLNAAPYYRKATELYIRPSDMDLKNARKRAEVPSGRKRKKPSRQEAMELMILANLAKSPAGPVKPAERQLLNKWIQANLPAIEQLYLGTAKPHCWFRYGVHSEAKESMLIHALLPYVGRLREITNALRWQMQFSAEKGDWDSVIADLRSAKKLARHFMHGPFLIEQVVGISVDTQANKQLIHLLRSSPLPPATLQRLAQSLPLDYPIVSMDGESLTHMDLIQWFFTDDGSGDGHMIPGTISMLRAAGMESSPPTIFEEVGMAMVHSSRRDTAALFEQWVQRARQYCSSTPYQNHISGYSLSVWAEKTMKENRRTFLFTMFIPALERAAWISYAGQAEHLATATIVALLRYKAEHGQFPQTLDELVPQYLKVIPDDPFGPGPLTYKRQGDDFILYSWGLNFEDHGGQHNKQTLTMKSESGDYVFWPPEPVERP